MTNVKKLLEQIISTTGGVVLVDKANDHAFCMLFSISLCNKEALQDDDLYGKHLLLERFFKTSDGHDIKNRLYTMSPSRADTAFTYYTKTAKTLLEFFYKTGYSENFTPDEGTIEDKLTIVEHEDCYDLYAYYGYQKKEDN